ncbi:MAG: hypothetical protein J1E63_07845 [Muribaculaceae bacterium]|nr:hypothetical protein [Muribaculaceae bacterium]
MTKQIRNYEDLALYNVYNYCLQLLSGSSNKTSIKLNPKKKKKMNPALKKANRRQLKKLSLDLLIKLTIANLIVPLPILIPIIGLTISPIYALFVYLLNIPTAINIFIFTFIVLYFCWQTGIIEKFSTTKREITILAVIGDILFVIFYMYVLIFDGLNHTDSLENLENLDYVEQKVSHFDEFLIALSHIMAFQAIILFVIIIGKAIKTVYPRLYERIVNFRLLKVDD